MSKNLNELKCEFYINNSIHNSIYNNKIFETSNQVFLVYYNNTNYFSYESQESLFSMEKRILYLSEYFLYIFKEDFNKMLTLPSEEFILSNQTNNQQYAENMYYLITKIRLNNIIQYIVKYEKLTIKFVPQLDSDTTKLDRDLILKDMNGVTEIDLQFSHSFDCILFINRIDALLKYKDYDKKIIKETMGIN